MLKKKLKVSRTKWGGGQLHGRDYINIQKHEYGPNRMTIVQLSCNHFFFEFFSFQSTGRDAEYSIIPARPDKRCNNPKRNCGVSTAKNGFRVKPPFKGIETTWSSFCVSRVFRRTMELRFSFSLKYIIYIYIRCFLP